MKPILPIYDKRSLESWVNACELRSSHEEISHALRNGIEVILLTGKSQSGKSSLLRTVAKDIPANRRLIFLKGKGLTFPKKLNESEDKPNLKEDHHNYVFDFNSFADFIIGSTISHDKLTVVIDDAHHISIKKLTKLFDINTKVFPETRPIQFLMTGLPTLVKKIQAIEGLTDQNFIQTSIDKQNIKASTPYTEAKEFSISSQKNEIQLNRHSSNKITSLVNNKRSQALYKLFEWSATLGKKYILSKVTKINVNRVIDYIQRYLYQAYKTLINAKYSLLKIQIHLDSYSSKIKSTIKILMRDIGLPVNDFITKIYNKTANIINVFISKLDIFINMSKKLVSMLQKEAGQNDKNYTSIKNLPGWDYKTVAISIITVATLVLSYYMQPTNHGAESNLVPIVSKNKLGNISSVKLKNINQISNIMPSLITNYTDTTLDTIIDKIISNTTINYIESIIETVEITDNPEIAEKIAVEQATPSSQETEISKLLKLAAEQFEARQLTTPAGNNAYETYQFILFTNPRNEDAQKGIEKIHDRYVGWANYNLQNNNNTRAKYYFNKALEIELDNQTTYHAFNALNQKQENLVDDIDLLLITESDNRELQEKLNKAYVVMQKINIDLEINKRTYSFYQDAQLIYQQILKKYPQTVAAKAGLKIINSYYLDWAVLEFNFRNFNTALFLYEQALSIQPNNSDVVQRIEEIKNSHLKG
ncbi:MAG: hypothetical protein HKN83_11775 [Gammaproteobacteria bacterium]|nr:hypothetical protein [Gammaproteobacteria bacterium]